MIYCLESPAAVLDQEPYHAATTVHDDQKQCDNGQYPGIVFAAVMLEAQAIFGDKRRLQPRVERLRHLLKVEQADQREHERHQRCDK